MINLLPVADGGDNCFWTVLRAPEELADIIADSGVSAMLYFPKFFVFENFEISPRNFDLKSLSFELSRKILEKTFKSVQKHYFMFTKQFLIRKCFTPNE